MSNPSESPELSQSELRLCFENAATGIAVIDSEGALLSVNPTLCRILGYNAEELIGLSLEKLVADDDPAVAATYFHQLIAAEVESYVCEECFRRNDGGQVWTRASVAVLSRLEGKVVTVVAIYEDITAQKNLEAQVRQAHKMDALGRFAGGVAHDFNNLLMIINSYASLLTDEFGKDSPMGRKAAAIGDAGNRAASLTRQLLAFSRKQVLKPRTVALDELVRSSQKLLRRLVREDIEIHTQFNSGGSFIEVDEGQFGRVLMNLAVNASEAMPRGGTLTFATETASWKSAAPSNAPYGSCVVLSVTDTGEGMDAATAERIFEPFFTSKKTGGTGLGLSTVYGIVEQSGGQITVESTLNKGTTFRVFLPVVREARSCELDSPCENPAEFRKLRATVLLAEDEEPLRRCLTNTLRAIGCYVLQAEDGQRALELARKQLLLIDVVISDIVMPHLGGVDLARELRSMRSNLPVILMSGYADVTPSHEELRSGKTIFIQKPFTPEVMKELIQRVLQQQAPSTPELQFAGTASSEQSCIR